MWGLQVLVWQHSFLISWPILETQMYPMVVAFLRNNDWQKGFGNTSWYRQPWIAIIKTKTVRD